MAINLPSIVRLKSCHSSEDGQHSSPGKHRHRRMAGGCDNPLYDSQMIAISNAVISHTRRVRRNDGRRTFLIRPPLIPANVACTEPMNGGQFLRFDQMSFSMRLVNLSEDWKAIALSVENSGLRYQLTRMGHISVPVGVLSVWFRPTTSCDAPGQYIRTQKRPRVASDGFEQA